MAFVGVEVKEPLLRPVFEFVDVRLEYLRVGSRGYFSKDFGVVGKQEPIRIDIVQEVIYVD